MSDDDLQIVAHCGCRADDIAGKPRVDTSRCYAVQIREDLRALRAGAEASANEIVALEQAQIRLADALRSLVQSYLRGIDRDQVYASEEQTEELRVLVGLVAGALDASTAAEPWIMRALSLGVPAGALLSPPPPPTEAEAEK